MAIGQEIGRRHSFLCAAGLAAVLVLLSDTVGAAPQALGLVATREAMPLQCDARECVVFLSAFCLEKERKPPSSLTRYRPTATSEITLLVETRAGPTVALPGRDYLRFRTRLDYTSVLARVSMARLAALAPVRVRVHVGPLASLVPVPAEGDADLHSAAELAVATGPYRTAGRRFFDDGGETAETVAMVTHLINAMPRRGRTARQARDAAYRATIARAAAGAAAQRRFRALVRGCESILAATADRYTMRDCLQYRHEMLQTETNQAFWKSLGGV